MVYIYSIIGFIVALLAITLKIKAIILIFAFIYVIYCYRHTEKYFWFTYFISLLLPIGDNNIINFISLNVYGKNINLIEMMQILIFLVIITKNIKIRKIKIYSLTNIFYITLMFLYIVYFIMGIVNGYDAISDIKKYILQLTMAYCVYRVVSKTKDIYFFMNITLYSITLNSAIALFIYITRKSPIWGIDYNQTRFGMNFETLFIITISYVLFLLYNRIYCIKKINIILSLVMSVILIFLSQNRTNPILLAVSVFLMIVLSFKYKKKGRSRKEKLILLIFMFAIFIIPINNLMNSQNAFIERLTQTKALKDETNIKTRINTFEYYIGEIKAKPLGMGAGKTITFIDADYRFQEEGFTIDNSYVTVGYKFGIVTLFIYMYFMFLPIFLLVKYYSIDKDKILIVILISYVMLIIAGSFLTSQIIHSYSVSTFVWVFIGFLHSKIFDKEMGGIG